MGFYEMFKDVIKVAKDAGNLDLYEKLLNLTEKAMELQDENIRLKKEIEQLKENDEIRKKLIFENNMYYLIDSDKKEGPYCSTCWDYEEKLIRIHKNAYDMLICPVCVLKKKN